MTESILTSIKKLLGIDESYDAFDVDVIMAINTVLNTLTQIGVGPKDGFTIEDDSAEWVDFIPNTKRLELIKSYVYLKVRLLFDPPAGSALEVFKEQIKELEWRISAEADYKSFD